MTIKLIVGWPTPVRNMPLPGTTLAPGMWIYWRIAIVRRCAKRANSSATPRASTAGEDVRLLVPTTFMNLSGKAVAAMATFIASTRMKFWSPMTSWIYRRAWRNLSLAVAMAATMA